MESKESVRLKSGDLEIEIIGSNLAAANVLSKLLTDERMEWLRETLLRNFRAGLRSARRSDNVDL